MRDAIATKQKILIESANLFNTQGYKATSISDITKATGFTKGAIYRHFENKQDLEQQALRNLSKLLFFNLGSSIKEAKTFKTKFDAIFEFFENYMESPYYEGGCPLMNVAVEVDDSNSVLRQQAFNMLAHLRASIRVLFLNGIKNKQVQPDIDVECYATIVISSLEGGIMMSKLERNKNAITHCVKHLKTVIQLVSI
jgi:TetR/AcrR family transcriptional repressor of nem operon